MLIGTKVMTQEAKTKKNKCVFFVQNHKKMEMEIFTFCVITFELIRVSFGTSTWLCEPRFCERWIFTTQFYYFLSSSTFKARLPSFFLQETYFLNNWPDPVKANLLFKWKCRVQSMLASNGKVFQKDEKLKSWWLSANLGCNKTIWK